MRRSFCLLIAAFALLASSATAAPPSDAEPDRYVGTTSADGPLSLSDAGSELRYLRVRWVAACEDGRFRGITIFRGTDVSSGGRFSSLARYRVGGLGEGRFARVSGVLEGRIERRKRARGSWSASVVIRNSRGRFVQRCTTGKLKWVSVRRAASGDGNTGDGVDSSGDAG